MSTATEPVELQQEQPKAAGQSWWQRDGADSVKRNLALIGVLLLLLIIGAITRSDIFLDPSRLWSNELTVLTQASSIGVIVVGMTFVMISGGIDLSVGALLALASVWCTTVATQDLGAGAMIFTALAVGAGAGLVNGVLISYGKLVPFIATLAMMLSARGLAQNISGSHTQITTEPVILSLAGDKLLGVPYMVIIFLLVVALGWILLNRTTFGRRTIAIGGNTEAARLAGINVRLQTLLLYVLSGLCCGIAALMVVSQTTSGSNTHGDLYELSAIAAAIIGGTALTGGRGTIVGSLLGVLIFTQITNLFIVNNLQLDIQRIINGGIIVAAVLIQQFRVTSFWRKPGAKPSATS
ncbi:ABC transporter permease [Dactylosporangium sp. AC04546]|uniref:ABC transporter permease n=1 Tax=Dactylosporangium sp. AC04546 TaxID=2862460 RepID=UPI001EE06A16|nr:ABC transporter permease [Dactylosporangium sp. AC04546]WVK82494.1 ABC transporter permease [Dactylosporangium sp. AC04546]